MERLRGGSQSESTLAGRNRWSRLSLSHQPALLPVCSLRGRRKRGLQCACHWKRICALPSGGRRGRGGFQKIVRKNTFFELAMTGLVFALVSAEKLGWRDSRAHLSGGRDEVYAQS